jgi:uncharacterized glyoxalase superfamily protein PhnB
LLETAIISKDSAMATPTPHRPAFIPSVIYRDNRAALEWLRNAFGFDVSGVFTDSQGNIAHAEMSHGDGVVMIGNEWVDWAKSPASIGGKNTQRIHVRIESGLDEHCEHARRAGAKIIMEPQDQFYGDRTYAAQDHEGHHWTFAQPVRHVSYEDMEKATGLKYAEKM